MIDSILSVLQEIQDTHCVAEIAFTGDTTLEFLDGENAEAALTAKLLIMELTYLDDTSTPEQAKVCEQDFTCAQKLSSYLVTLKAVYIMD